MREAIGSSMLLYIVVIIVSIVMLLFASMMSYAKASSAKNKVLSALETFEGYTTDAKAQIEADLGRMGYTVSSSDFCDTARVKNHLNELGVTHSVNLNSSTTGRYSYCVYNVNLSNGNYYIVATFINFNIPFIGQTLVFPVYGQTKIMNINYEY